MYVIKRLQRATDVFDSTSVQLSCRSLLRRKTNALLRHSICVDISVTIHKFLHFKCTLLCCVLVFLYFYFLVTWCGRLQPISFLQQVKQSYRIGLLLRILNSVHRRMFQVQSGPEKNRPPTCQLIMSSKSNVHLK